MYAKRPMPIAVEFRTRRPAPAPQGRVRRSIRMSSRCSSLHRWVLLRRASSGSRAGTAVPSPSSRFPPGAGAVRGSSVDTGLISCIGPPARPHRGSRRDHRVRIWLGRRRCPGAGSGMAWHSGGRRIAPASVPATRRSNKSRDDKSARGAAMLRRPRDAGEPVSKQSRFRGVPRPLATRAASTSREPWRVLPGASARLHSEWSRHEFPLRPDVERAP